jgi:hypothetical protein
MRPSPLPGALTARRRRQLAPCWTGSREYGQLDCSSTSYPTVARILEVLWDTAEQLIVGGVTRSHDMTGVVFQRLIADRKFLATYYTSPSAAALLAGFAIPLERPIAGENWSDAAALGEARIGDFACGTGTLLSTAYQRIGLLHEIYGGNPRELHPRMMQRGLVGLDVLTVAVHLTAAMLAGSYPDTPFEGECLLTMPYGSHDWGVCAGSLDLLERHLIRGHSSCGAHRWRERSRRGT